MQVKTLIKGMNVDDTIIPLKQLLAAEEVIAESKNVLILSFRASLYYSSEIIEFTVAGTMFSEKQKKQFAKLKPQSDIYFDNIRAKSPQGFIVCLKPVLYHVAE